MYRRDCLDKIGCETCLIWLCADWAFPFFVFIVLSSLCCFSIVDALIYPASEPRPPVKDMNTSRNTAWPPPVISLCYHFGKRRNTVRIYYSCLHWPNENCVARKNTSFFDLFFCSVMSMCRLVETSLLFFFFFFYMCTASSSWRWSLGKLTAFGKPYCGALYRHCLSPVLISCRCRNW